MRLALHILGTEVLAITTDPDEGEPGDATSTSAGFIPPPTLLPPREPGRDYDPDAEPP